MGPQTPIDWKANVTEGLLVKRGDHNEKLNQILLAQSDYALGLQRFPKNKEFDKAAGRLALSLGQCEEAAAHLKRAVSTPLLDYETLYYAGTADSLCGNSREAARLLSQVSAASEFGPPAALERAYLAAREGNTALALQLIQPWAPIKEDMAVSRRCGSRCCVAREPGCRPGRGQERAKIRARRSAVALRGHARGDR